MLTFLILGVLSHALSLVYGAVDQTTLAATGAPDCPPIMRRAEWGAREPRPTDAIRQPVPCVIIHHTETASCFSLSTCPSIVKSIQDDHMDTKGWDDIGYNFLVGEVGWVFEGRGWDRVGAHTPGYNSVSIGIAVIGSFSSNPPDNLALDAVQQLIKCGVSLGKLSDPYSLDGHRDLGVTDCPGQSLYSIINTWQHSELTCAKPTDGAVTGVTLPGLTTNHALVGLPCYCPPATTMLFEIESDCYVYCDCDNGVGIIKPCPATYTESIYICWRRSDVTAARLAECDAP